MKKILLLLVLHFSLQFCEGRGGAFAQQINNPDVKRTWHWHFGEKAALDFSNGSPVAKTTSELGWSQYGVASMADIFGNLLFYTDGRTVWNKDNQIMPNGSGLEAGPGVGVSQQVLIVPRPKHDSIYYIFYLWTSPDSATYKYSVVNLNLNNGLGDVIQKNVTLIKGDPYNSPPDTIINTKQNATRHKNGIDYWVVVNQWNTNNYFAYLITSAGVNHLPLVSSAGTPDNATTNHLKISPSGKRIITGKALNGTEILDFDNETGIVSNPISLPYDPDRQDYSVEFSPDETKIYIGRLKPSNNQIRELYQVNLAAGSVSDIINSITLVGTPEAYYNGLGAIQMASDGKLYIARVKRDSLGVINNPNALGTACDYTDNGPSLANRFSWTGLPNIINSYFYDFTTGTNNNKTAGNEAGLKMYPLPARDIITVKLPAQAALNENKISFSLYDFSGKQASLIADKKSEREFVLDLTGLPSGFYLLRTLCGESIYTSKIIIHN